MPNEHIEIQRELSLGSEFTNIVEQLGIEGSVLHEAVEEGKQYKYQIDNPQAVKDRLTVLRAVQATGPVEQVDYYFLYPDQQPGFLTESLCWREERHFVDYSPSGELDVTATGQLIYKTNPHSDAANHTRNIRRIHVASEDMQLEVLSKIKDIRQGHDFAPYSVAKKRTTYLLPLQDSTAYDPVVIHIDEDVQLNDRSPDTGYAAQYVGNFLEITAANGQADVLEKVKNRLGITGEPFNVPYIAKAAFVHKLHRTKPSPNKVLMNSVEAEWLRSTHKPYYYDAARDEFVVGIDPVKISQLDRNEQVEAQQQIVQICEDLDRSDGGAELPSRAAGGGSGSTTYERLVQYDGLNNYSTLCSRIQSADLYRKRWQPGDKRIVFSRVAFSEDSNDVGLFVHFVGSHDAYEAWLRRHHK